MNDDRELVDAAPARERLAEFRAEGFGWSKIATLTGLSKETLRSVAEHGRLRIQSRTSGRIMSARAGFTRSTSSKPRPPSSCKCEHLRIQHRNGLGCGAAGCGCGTFRLSPDG